MFEALESRQLFAVGLSPGGTLSVTGTAGNDMIYFDQVLDAGVWKVAVHDNGVVTPFALGAVNSIVVQTYDGNDGVGAYAGLGKPMTVFGGAGNDNLSGAEADDVLYGGPGNDVLYGSYGNDALKGEGGGDRVYGEWGDDALSGGIGDDRLFGGTGNDTLDGGAGADWMYGEDDDDYLVANDSAADNLVDGGTHVLADTAVWDAGLDPVVNIP